MSDGCTTSTTPENSRELYLDPVTRAYPRRAVVDARTATGRLSNSRLVCTSATVIARHEYPLSSVAASPTLARPPSRRVRLLLLRAGVKRNGPRRPSTTSPRTSPPPPLTTGLRFVLRLHLTAHLACSRSPSRTLLSLLPRPLKRKS